MSKQLKTIFLLAVLCSVSLSKKEKDFELTHNIDCGERNSAQVIGIAPVQNYIIVGFENTTTVMYNEKLEHQQSYAHDKPLSGVGCGGENIALANPQSDVHVYNEKKELQYTTTDSYYNISTVSNVAFDSDDTYMVIGVGYYLDIYNANPWGLSSTKYQVGYKTITDIAFSIDNTILASASEQHVQFYKVDEDGKWNLEDVSIECNGNEVHIAFSTDYLAISMGDDTVKILKLSDWSEEKTITLDKKVSQTIAFQNDKFLAVGTENDGVQIYKVGSWDLFQTLLEDTDHISAMKFSENLIVIDYVEGNENKLSVFRQGGGNGGSLLFLSSFALIISFFML